MTEGEIIEANKVIADFDGWRQVEKWGALYFTKDDESFNKEVLPYHLEWGLIMPVGKKIFDYLQSEIKNRPPHLCSQGDLLEVNITCAIREYDIVKAHEYIFQWIEWYNTQSINKP